MITLAPKLRIGVFAGGVSSEREVSLKSAAQVVANLSPDKYEVHMIEVAPDGGWLMDATTPISFQDLRNIDLAFIAMHGTFAEDGRIQSLFELLHIPYTGSGVLASALGMDKAKTREIVGLHGVISPARFELYSIPADTDALDIRIQSEVHYPCVIKPTSSGSSIGVSIIDTKASLAAALTEAFAESGTVLVEQHIKGREVTCGVLGNSHQTNLTPLPVAEIITDAKFFDYSAKYESAQTKEICPADLPASITTQIQSTSIAVHEALGCDGLTRSDFILGEDGVLYFLEINTIPGMTEASICPKEARAAGMSFAQLLDEQIALAMKRHTTLGS